MTLQMITGEVFAEKYRIEHRLGAGGMGQVVAARHIELGQQVAIKILHKEVAESAEAMARFMREGQAAVRLRSTHAARVLDVGRVSSGMPYLVLEYLDGKDLSQILEEFGPLPLQEAVDYLLQACEAVADAHSLGIVHRDLKPANLFVTLDPFGQKQIKVLDFGISKWSATDQTQTNTPGSMTNTAVVMGSPLYMPPEQMRSARAADERSDIWALGTILWELLTGRHIWEAETMSAICMRVASDPTPSLCAVRPDLPLALDAIINQCLQKDPAHRFQRVLDLAIALAPFGGADAPEAISRIRHFSGPSALTGAPQDSAVLAQTPQRAQSSRDSGQPRKLGTVTPDTWLSGSDPNLPLSQSGSSKIKWAAVVGLVAALAAGVLAVSQRATNNPEASAPNLEASATNLEASAPNERGQNTLKPTDSHVQTTRGQLENALPVSGTATPNAGADAGGPENHAPKTDAHALPTAIPSKGMPARAKPQPLSASVLRPRLEASTPTTAASAAPVTSTARSATPDWGGRQ